MRRLFQVLTGLAVLLWGTAVAAHALPGTAVLLDFRGADVGATLEIPLDQLELSFKRPLMDAPMVAADRYSAELDAYLRQHIVPAAPDGRAWSVTVDRLRTTPANETAPIELRADLTLTPPPGAPGGQFRFNYSVVNHEVMTHTVMVFARNDWNNGVSAARPELLGTIRWLTTGLDVDRTRGSFWRGMSGVVRMGMLHIAEGTDHLLFLLTLLLPAPLLAGRGRWVGYGGARHAVIRLGALVSAFTLGHSLTLVVGAFGNVALPSKPVEVAIALTIFISALHAWRPLLRGRDAWVAGGFGLIHGLAFSQLVAGAGLDGWHKAAAVFGFNLGIEIVQLAVVAAVTPWLILLARSGRDTAVRLAGAAFAAVASLAWMAERVSGHTNPVSELLPYVFTAAPCLLAALALAALASLRGARRGDPRAPEAAAIHPAQS